MKKHLLSLKLFRAYIGWFICFMIVLLSISIGFMAFMIHRNFEDPQEQLINSIDENVQNYFEEMNAFSMELMNDQTFKKTAVIQLPQEYADGKSTTESFSQLYRDAYKMFQKSYNVGIIVNDSYYIWMGRRYHIHQIDPAQIHTYDTLVRNEKPVVKYLEQNDYLAFSGSEENDGDGSYITLSRSMDLKNQYLNGKQILEIQVETEDFVNDMKKLSGDSSAVQINIFDQDGNALYQESRIDMTEYLKEDFRGGTLKSDVISVRELFEGNLTVIYMRNSGDHLRMRLAFWVLALLAGCGFVGIILWMTYRVSQQISEPISMICERVGKINLKEGRGYEEVETDIEELQMLSHSVKEMSDDLQESLQEIIALKEYELHAKLLALQAQMQPHFLFNTLMNITSLAEEEGNERIYRICMNLTGMFRYISADNPEGVNLYEEIRHVENYVDIMKERFPESYVRIDIPLEMMKIRIPKLTVQPLVENAFKYCNRNRPEILVKGIMEESGGWAIQVGDNGAGFSHEKKAEIMRKCEEGLKSENVLSNQINGMGLVNVYARMQLFYGKESMLYQIEENRGSVIIGKRNRKDDLPI